MRKNLIPMRKERLYVLCTVCFAILAAGCNSVQQVLKSGRPDHMYQTALKHYQNQKWSKAAMLFEAAAVEECRRGWLKAS